jgi:hypothetical protein
MVMIERCLLLGSILHWGLVVLAVLVVFVLVDVVVVIVVVVVVVVVHGLLGRF